MDTALRHLAIAMLQVEAGPWTSILEEAQSAFGQSKLRVTLQEQAAPKQLCCPHKLRLAPRAFLPEVVLAVGWMQIASRPSGMLE